MLTLVPAALAGRCVRCCEAAAEMLSWPSEAEVTPSCAGRTMLPPPHGLFWVVSARLAWEKASGESRVAIMTGQCLVREHQGEQASGAEKQAVLWSLTRMLSCVSSEVLKGTSSVLHWHQRGCGCWLQGWVLVQLQPVMPLGPGWLLFPLPYVSWVWQVWFVNYFDRSFQRR